MAVMKSVMLPSLLASLAHVANRTLTMRQCANESRATRPLMFNADGKFQISIFEDLHLGENAWDAWGHQQDLSTVKVVEGVLDAEKPDLVVFNGDIITGENAFLENSTKVIDMLAAPLVRRTLPWASTYGNHDHSLNLSAADILAHEQRWPNARTKTMTPGRDAGVSNYYLPVYGPGCCHSDCRPELLLWFFDSRGGLRFQDRDEHGSPRAQPNWVDTSVVDWFQQAQANLSRQYGRALPSLAFVHIPPYAFLALQTAKAIDAHRQPGINDDNPLAAQAQGWCPDGRNDASCGYGGQDVPFIKALSETPGLVGLFSGHDHGNSWCVRWDDQVPGMTVAGRGLDLCFGQRSGYGGYGQWVRGGRQVRVSRQNTSEAETWIRLDTGDVVGNIMLNSTFGKDWYPTTPNDKSFCSSCNYSVVTSRPLTRRKKV
ncbi:hypothetical protein L249_4357 [Ophiocordyceps polyrhachis-furcata BCC 54312]|uniref:Calcineurin-like phosphoesterase domain-containing protein n=1 Tax=Ophiocordyceps polyrhachis-furcata BCC 54312 TaxID=1330021 RepID=A0A367L7K9_9HYPO|nr:hypothetical protein L249_4357 [Ophiocordyceps polyrhachis-furcata BCC 54312]